MKVTPTSIFWIFLLVLLSCLDERDINRKYPVVTTMEVTEVGPEGATFSGQVEESKQAEISEFGFVWATSSELSIESSYSRKFAKGEQPSFQLQIQSTLLPDQKYFVRAYVRWAGKVVYGNEVSFLSKGSLGPKISELLPSKGVFGDTVLIKGRNFYGGKEPATVTFATKTASVLAITDTTFLVIVPRSLPTSKESIAVVLSVPPAKVATSFTLDLDRILPRIASVSKKKVRACDTLTVVGKNFLSDAESVTVSLSNNEHATVLKATNDSVVFRLSGLPPVPFNFTIVSGSFESAPPDSMVFQSVFPSIVSYDPPTYFPGEEITFTFNDLPACLSVQTSPAQLISQNGNKIKVYFSEECYTAEGMSVGFLFANRYAVYSDPIKRAALKLTSLSPRRGKVGDAVVLKGENFSTLDPSIYDFLDVTFMSKTEIKGTIREVYAPDGFVDIPVLSCGSGDTLIHAFQFDAPIITDFNPKVITSIDQTITIAGRNFSAFGNSVMVNGRFVSGTELIEEGESSISFSASSILEGVLVEETNSGPVKVQTYRGQSTTASVPIQLNYLAPWKKLADFPGVPRAEGIAFGSGGKGYAGLGRGVINNTLSDFRRDWWEYDPATDKWTAKAPFPGTESYFRPNATVLNDKGYIINAVKELWSYESATDTWVRKADIPLLYAYIVLSAHNAIYAVGAATQLSSKAWRRFDPETNTWTSLPDLPFTTSNEYLHYFLNGSFHFFGYDSQTNKIEMIFDVVSGQWTTRPTFFNFSVSQSDVHNFDDYVIVCVRPGLSAGTQLMKISGTGSIEYLPFVPLARSSYISFRIGNHLHVGLGGTTRPNLVDLWLLDISKL